MFVGRDRELADLRRGFEEARAGRGRLFLIVGEPGIGKTRLTDECATHAEAGGAQVLRGRCWEGGGAPAYWPWAQVIRSCLRGRGADSLRADVGTGGAHMAQIVPDLREILPDLRTLPVAQSPAAEDARFYLFDATTTFLKNVAQRQPVVLILDDLHAADAPSLLLLQFLARDLQHARILALCTFRPVEVRRNPAVARVLGELAREGTSLPLAGLTEPDVGRVIREAAGISPADSVVSTIYGATQGNPFFVVEVVRLLIAEGRLQQAGPVAVRNLGIPEGVRGAIHRRIEPLGDETRRVLSVAAVIGRDFDLTPLQQGSEAPLEALLEILGDALSHGIIVEAPGTIGRYSFCHALVRETLYDELTPTGRLRLHERIGKVLEDLYSSNPEDHLAELAHHFLEAARGGEAERALGYAARAGHRAVALLAYEEAVSHFERALNALALLPLANETRRCELLVALCEAQLKAGRFGDAVVTCRHVVGLARQLGAVEHLARATLAVAGQWAEDSDTERFLVGLLEEVLVALGKEDSALRALALSQVASHYAFFNLSWQRAAALSREGVEVARRVGDGAALARALDVMHHAFWAATSSVDRLAAATEITRLAEAAGNRELVLRGHHWRLHALMELGDLVEVDRAMASYSTLAEESRQPGLRWFAGVVNQMRAMLAGRFELAERLARQTYDLGQRCGLGGIGSVFESQLLCVRWAQGRVGEIEPDLRAAVDERPNSTGRRAALAFLYSEAGRLGDARVEFERLARDDFAGIPKNEIWPPAMAFLSAVAASLGDAARAATLYELFSPWAGLNVAINTFVGPASHFLGLLAGTMNRRDEAARHFNDAVAKSETMGARPFVAVTKYAHARMIIDGGRREDRARALAMLDEAVETARQFRMAGVLANAEHLRNESDGAAANQCDATIDPPAPRSAPAGDQIDGVFRRDGRYWRVEYRGEVVRLRDSSGLRYLAALLGHPGEELHVLYLLSTTDACDPGGAGATTGLVLDADLHPSRPSDAGALLDPQAKAAYRRRLQELRENLEEAEAAGDSGRAERADEEIEALTAELARAVGLRGRDRRAGSSAERARVNLTKLIKGAIRKVADANPSLGHHLAACIRTGTYCGYRPDPAVSVRWTF